jgi:hypothetical protein
MVNFPSLPEAILQRNQELFLALEAREASQMISAFEERECRNARHGPEPFKFRSFRLL